MQRWKPSGARLNARPWKEANNGPRIGFDGSYSNSSKRPITGAGSTALWGINHLWTSNKTTTKKGKDRVKYCDHKKGGREYRQAHGAECPNHLSELVGYVPTTNVFYFKCRYANTYTIKDVVSQPDLIEIFSPYHFVILSDKRIVVCEQA